MKFFIAIVFFFAAFKSLASTPQHGPWLVKVGSTYIDKKTQKSVPLMGTGFVIRIEGEKKQDQLPEQRFFVVTAAHVSGGYPDSLTLETSSGLLKVKKENPRFRIRSVLNDLEIIEIVKPRHKSASLAWTQLDNGVIHPYFYVENSVSEGEWNTQTCLRTADNDIVVSRPGDFQVKSADGRRFCVKEDKGDLSKLHVEHLQAKGPHKRLSLTQMVVLPDIPQWPRSSLTTSCGASSSPDYLIAQHRTRLNYLLNPNHIRVPVALSPGASGSPLISRRFVPRCRLLMVKGVLVQTSAFFHQSTFVSDTEIARLIRKHLGIAKPDFVEENAKWVLENGQLIVEAIVSDPKTKRPIVTKETRALQKAAAGLQLPISGPTAIDPGGPTAIDPGGPTAIDPGGDGKTSKNKEEGPLKISKEEAQKIEERLWRRYQSHSNFLFEGRPVLGFRLTERDECKTLVDRSGVSGVGGVRFHGLYEEQLKTQLKKRWRNHRFVEIIANRETLKLIGDYAVRSETCYDYEVMEEGVSLLNSLKQRADQEKKSFTLNSVKKDNSSTLSVAGKQVTLNLKFKTPEGVQESLNIKLNEYGALGASKNFRSIVRVTSASGQAKYYVDLTNLFFADLSQQILPFDNRLVTRFLQPGIYNREYSLQEWFPFVHYYLFKSEEVMQPRVKFRLVGDPTGSDYSILFATSAKKAK